MFQDKLTAVNSVNRDLRDKIESQRQMFVQKDKAAASKSEKRELEQAKQFKKVKKDIQLKDYRIT